jgi:hypothetical protein
LVVFFFGMTLIRYRNIYKPSYNAKTQRRFESAKKDNLICLGKFNKPVAMYLLGKYINDLVPGDLERLIQNQIPESTTLDYKQQLNIEEDKEKNRLEFLHDICSFYNTNGGCIIYGISEKRTTDGRPSGLPHEFVNQEYDNLDTLKQRIHDIVRVQTDPNITNIIPREIIVQEKKVLVIGIQRTYSLPAMVTYNGSNKFYKRSISGKYLADTMALYNMFLQNQIIGEKANQFKELRITEVRNQRIISNLRIVGSFFLHIIPYSFLEEKIIDLKKLEDQQKESLVTPIFIRDSDTENGYTRVYNLDGYVTYRKNRRIGLTVSYNQYFRNGIIEFYTSSLRWQSDGSSPQFQHFFGYPMLDATINQIQKGLQTLKYLQIEAPFLIYISIYDTFNTYLISGVSGNVIGLFDRDLIALPPITINETELNSIDIFPKLKNHFDTIWQAAGASEAPDSTTFFHPSRTR